MEFALVFESIGGESSPCILHMKWFHNVIQLLYHHKLHILEQALDSILDSGGGYVEAVDFVGTRFELKKITFMSIRQKKIKCLEIYFTL